MSRAQFTSDWWNHCKSNMSWYKRMPIAIEDAKIKWWNRSEEKYWSLSVMGVWYLYHSGFCLMKTWSYIDVADYRYTGNLIKSLWGLPCPWYITVHKNCVSSISLFGDEYIGWMNLVNGDLPAFLNAWSS